MRIYYLTTYNPISLWLNFGIFLINAQAYRYGLVLAGILSLIHIFEITLSPEIAFCDTQEEKAQDEKLEILPPEEKNRGIRWEGILMFSLVVILYVVLARYSSPGSDMGGGNAGGPLLTSEKVTNNADVAGAKVENFEKAQSISEISRAPNLGASEEKAAESNVSTTQEESLERSIVNILKQAAAENRIKNLPSSQTSVDIPSTSSITSLSARVTEHPQPFVQIPKVHEYIRSELETPWLLGIEKNMRELAINPNISESVYRTAKSLVTSYQEEYPEMPYTDINVIEGLKPILKHFNFLEPVLNLANCYCSAGPVLCTCLSSYVICEPCLSLHASLNQVILPENGDFTIIYHQGYCCNKCQNLAGLQV